MNGCAFLREPDYFDNEKKVSSDSGQSCPRLQHKPVLWGFITLVNAMDAPIAMTIGSDVCDVGENELLWVFRLKMCPVRRTTSRGRLTF
jgi:hypothetical protein